MQGSRNLDFKVVNENVSFKGISGKVTGNAHKLKYGDVTWHHPSYDPKTNTTKMQLVTTANHNAVIPHKGSVKEFEDFTQTKL